MNVGAVRQKTMHVSKRALLPLSAASLRHLCLAASLVLIIATTVWAKIGLRTKFGDIVLENVEIGETYNLREARRVPFIVTNIGTDSTEVIVEVVIPDVKELKDGYEAVPDPTWLRILPRTLMLQQQENGFFDIILGVPNDPKYKGRHYQADIWAHTGGEGMFGAGVKGRVRFSTGAGPEALKAEKLKKLMYTLDFEMTPEEIYVNDVPLGEPVDVKQATGKSIKIANFATTPLPLRFKSIPWDSRFRVPIDYETAPDPSWISLTPAEARIESDSIAQCKITVSVPKDKAYRSKKYAFLVQAGVVDGMDLEVYTRVFVTTRD